MAHQVRRDRAAAEALLPATVTLANNNHVHLVVTDHLEQRSTRVTVEDVHCNSVALRLELLAVRVHLLHRLKTKLAKQLVLLLNVDGKRTRDPWTAEHISRQDRGHENVTARLDRVALHDVVEGKVARLSAVHSKKHLVARVVHLLARETDNVLRASLIGNRILIEGVARLEHGRLRNLGHPEVRTLNSTLTRLE